MSVFGTSVKYFVEKINLGNRKYNTSMIGIGRLSLCSTSWGIFHSPYFYQCPEYV
jgi:hypothetical protein